MSKYYLIGETLVECTAKECHCGEKQYVAVLTPEEWQEERDDFEMGIDMELDAADSHTTKAEVNYDSLTGTFSIPRKDDMDADADEFAFALDEKGIVFIDSGNTVSGMIASIIPTRKWHMPSLERFFYDFLEQVIAADAKYLEKIESELDSIEKEINSDKDTDADRVNTIRSHLRVLRTHYDRLLIFSQELEENENNFFKPVNLRLFSMITKRLMRLSDMVKSLIDYSIQVQDNYKSRQADKQNRIITLLTVVTTIFMPLTLIVGWYGMNFKYMPELDSVYGYPGVIIVSVLVAVVSLVFFKLKKWL